MKKIVQLLILLLAYNIAFSQPGSFDSTFSHNGKVITKFDKPAGLHALALQGDGKIIAAGTANNKFTIVRYNTNGSPDNSFGDKGIVKGLRGDANAVAIQDNEKIVVAGVTSKPHGNYKNANVTVARYNINGSVDSGFGNNGSVTIDEREADYCKAIAIQPDGKIVLAGTTGPNVLLIRLNKDGSYDTNFGDSGKKIAAVDKYGWTIGYIGIRAIALQTDGKILVGGFGTDVNGTDLIYSVLMRFKRNGDVDKSFGNNGKADLNGTNIYDIAVQSNGKILCAGSYSTFFSEDHGYGYTQDAAISRYTKDGIIDNTYAQGGYVNVANVRPWATPIFSLALLPNDKSVSTIQNSFPGSDTTLDILKYNAKGETDSTFGNHGEKIFTNPNLQSNASPTTPILVQPDGKIVVGCTYNGNSFFVARLLDSKANNENTYSAPLALNNINVNKKA